jgi:hypothetical protein
MRRNACGRCSCNRGSAPVLVARLSDPMRPIFWYEFDSDGRVIYVTIADRQSDVYVAELARR